MSAAEEDSYLLKFQSAFCEVLPIIYGALMPTPGWILTFASDSEDNKGCFRRQPKKDWFVSAIRIHRVASKEPPAVVLLHSTIL